MSQSRVLPGLAEQYNHDLHVAPEFARQYQLIGKLLQPEAEVLGAFDLYDAEASARKRQFHFLGVTALFMGTFALIALVVELLVYALHTVPSPLGTMAIEIAALFAFVIAVWSRCARLRERWRNACFVRERIRQWHFQRFLDGQLVEGLVAGSKPAIETNRRRFAEFVETLRTSDGALFEFLHDPSVPSRLLHSVTEYSNDAVRREVFRALDFLRFQHQSQFAQRKVVAHPQGRRVTLHEHYHWAVTVASASLLLAMIVPAFHIVLHLLERFHVVRVATALHPLLFGVAIALAVISAASHAFCSGFTIPEEIDSYHEYTARIMELRKAFHAAEVPPLTQQRRLRDLELEAARELRRFLLLKEKATFLM